MKLVFGLGNPGRKYARTRHNIGFRVVERLMDRHRVCAEKRQLEAVVAFSGTGDERVGYIRPQTYMNDSGRAVRGLASYYRVGQDDLFIVCDDLALPLGKLRLRRAGSDGGQKGLRSIANHLGTRSFARLRIGIGAPHPEMDAADYVLSRFREDEAATLEAAIDRAADCVELWLERGVEAAMNGFNVREAPREKARKKIGTGDEETRDPRPAAGASTDETSASPAGGAHAPPAGSDLS